MNNLSHIDAHHFCTKNREQLAQSDLCGCFFCLRIYQPDLITDWAYETNGETTAICPFCGIDAVIPSAAGYPLTPEFLEKMKAHWFKPVDEDDGGGF